MFRDTEFRAWDGSTMYTQKSFCFTFGRNNKDEIGKYWSCYMYSDSGGHFCCESSDKETILMQYSSYRDKNDKKIFEGDIVNGCSFNGSYAYGEVVFKHGRFYIEGIGKFIEGIAEIEANLEFIEVIGNKYENENLMK